MMMISFIHKKLRAFQIIEICKKAYFIFTSLLLFSAFSVSAQVTIGVDSEPSKFSLLDLKENAQGTASKGFHSPRMTEIQRNALISSPADTVAAVGLLIYNLDQNCENFWNGKEWISLCQGSSNPEINIPESACNKIKVYGQYYKNAPLNNSHYMTIPIEVLQKGNYSIIAKSNNGYYFQASGILDAIGTFELKLDGMGTPAQNGTDILEIFCNGAAIGSICTVKINVGAQTMGYQADCDGINVIGSYQTRSYLNPNDNYVKVPIDVIVDGVAIVETGLTNNMKFVCNQTIGTLGADTLILRPQGTPKQAGKFTFTFTTNGSIKTTCSFEVTFTSTLGQFADPACKCLDIYEENPMADNGEYWLQDCIATTYTTPVKTYCDIQNGGWTLVWSYSEQTAYSTYSPTGQMEVRGSTYGVGLDTPRNRVTTDGGMINYADFRLTRDEWLHFPNSTGRQQLKVRIADDPKDMNDAWGLNNYGIISPRNNDENPILRTTFSARARIPAEGKIYGKRWAVYATGGGSSGGWDEVSGNRGSLTLYSNGTYCTHWDFGNDLYSSQTQFQVVPNPAGNSGDSNSIAMRNINNAFGWFGETQSNHHFGKLGGAAGDNFSFLGTNYKTGSNLVPHTHQPGGRYLQWFVR